MPQRFQREIEEILQRSSQLPEGNVARRRAGPLGFVPSSPRDVLRSISPGKILFASLALLLSALFVRSVAPGVVGLLLWTSLVLFIIAYAMFFARWEGKGIERRWRGQVIESPPHPSRWQRLRRRLRF